MRHRKRGRKLNRNASHRRSLMRNLARALILSKSGRIVTTLVKAKEVRPFVEKLVTLGRHGDPASKRWAAALLGEHAFPYRTVGADGTGPLVWKRIPAKPRDPEDRKRWRRLGLPVLPDQRIHKNDTVHSVMAVDRLFREIAPKFKDRPGGYTRILRMGAKRLNDKAEEALLEFVVPVGEMQEPSPSTEPKATK